MKYNLNKKRCAKQTVIAILENNGEFWMGTNSCKDAQVECPRKESAPGVDYDKCLDICHQEGHAEAMAIKAAGKKANGSTLYLLGHSFLCDNCRKLVNDSKIKNVIIVRDHWYKAAEGGDNAGAIVGNEKGTDSKDKSAGCVDPV